MTTRELALVLAGVLAVPAAAALMASALRRGRADALLTALPLALLAVLAALAAA
jgi:hypothetical protein